MASVSVVGQHSEPKLFLHKVASGSKKFAITRKSSFEKMMFRRSSVSGGCRSLTSEAVSAGEEPLQIHPPSPGQPIKKVAKGMLKESCGALPAQTPRSLNSDREEGINGDSSGRSGRGRTAGTKESQTGQCRDHNGSIDCDSNQNTGGRKTGTSLKKTIVNAMPSALVSNGHMGTHTHRDTGNVKRASLGCSRQQSLSVALCGETGGLPLDRLTQGRTGVVKLTRTGPYRKEAWSIFPQEDPRVRTEKGEGHRFESKPVTTDWCDACSCQVTAQALKCQNCSYTCHPECEDQVQLDCNQRDRETPRTPPRSPPSGAGTATPQNKLDESKGEEGGPRVLSEDEARRRIEDYNAQVSENGMNLASDGSYTGFIKVHLRLSRPVTVPAVEGQEAGSGPTDKGSRPMEGQEEAGEGAEPGQSDRRTSFYLPCDCVKQLHISSATTAREVIQGLLKKFMVLDNPRKFALYRQTHRDGQDLFQKLPLCERPLSLRLMAGPDPELLSFVLKENETGEVEWHAFSLPELQNFLVILGKEESERVRTVEQKYAAYRKKLQLALRQHDP